ncbi:TPA: AAA family ATPase [Providencia alcalifaciens]
MNFKNIKISGWRQFYNIEIDFHPRVTIIAGANGAGKSTLLRILSQHFGYSQELIATPKMTEKGVFNYITGLFRLKKKADSIDSQPIENIGTLTYSDNKQSQLQVPQYNSALYSINILNMNSVNGLFINSHRPSSGYQTVSSIPTNAISVEQAYQLYHQEVMNKYNNSYSNYSPIYRIKEAIISMATFGPGNKNVQKNSGIEKNYEDFKEILSKILPNTIGFKDISIRIPDIVIITKTGEFVLDAASGGLMALIDLAWQMFLYSREKSSFVAILDEPENHLHPSMQRVIINNLLEAFPNAQLIVATHSPFIVSSVRESSVYVLRYGNESEGPLSTVYSEKLDNINKAGTASEILRSVLGVPVTLPLWAENDIDIIATEFDINTLTTERIAALRRKLESVGLGDYYSDALNRIAQRQ